MLRVLGMVVAMAVSPASAATLIVDGAGRLIGAADVDVGGTLYDVEFADGSCTSLFDGCDSIDDFTFVTQAEATAAAQALLDQVLVDGPAGQFDSVPSQVAGCAGATSVLSGCAFLIPFDPANASSYDLRSGLAFNRRAGG